MEARDWSERLFQAAEDELAEIDRQRTLRFEARTVDGTLSLKMTDLETSLRRALIRARVSRRSEFVGSLRVVSIGGRSRDDAIRGAVYRRIRIS